MHLSDHRLNQIDEAYVQTLGEGVLRGLSLRLLEDLKEAREWLRQNPNNSSRPPSSRAPWDRPPVGDEAAQEEAAQEAADATTPPDTRPKVKGKAGKQPGAAGVGRTQVLQAHETLRHRPSVCAACAQPVPEDARRVAYAGFQSVDLVWGDPAQPGLRLQVTDHRDHEIHCACGHCTRARPAEGFVEDPRLEPVALSEWRLVGSGLATLIVGLHLRLRLSRRRMREFLHEGPPVDLPCLHAALLAGLHAACVRLLGHRHAKTRALAVELWNDWDAIFRVLEHPEWPLTNNDAERPLRHWVIARRIMMGTRCDAGSCTLTLLASVIETYRQRGHGPWSYLAGVIADRRAGRTAASLPVAVPGL